MPGSELAPLPPAVEALPSPRDFKRLLQERLEAEILRVRNERGEVIAPEDTYALIRSLQRFRELMGEYARAMTSVAAVAAQEANEELLTAVGEQDGVPNSGMTVPDTDGTEIKITLDQSNSYTIDLDTVIPLLASFVVVDAKAVEGLTNFGIAIALADDEHVRTAATNDMAEFLVTLMSDGIRRALELGSFTPQVSKVRALAKQLAARGQDQLASLVSGAIRATKSFKGIKIDRKEGKP